MSDKIEVSTNGALTMEILENAFKKASANHGQVPTMTIDATSFQTALDSFHRMKEINRIRKEIKKSLKQSIINNRNNK